MRPEKPRQNALRVGRYSAADQIYLLTWATHRRRPLFLEFRTGRLVVSEMRHAHQAGWVDSLAFVVMPDHCHWLIALQSPDLAQLMRLVKGRSARAVNRHLGRSGPCWQSAFHDHALRDEESLRGMADYILLNPVRAGLVDDLGDYPLWDTAWDPPAGGLGGRG